MKTYHIKDLVKNELLIVELPEDTQFDVFVDNPIWKDGIKFLTGPEEKFHFIRGNYTLLGKPDEIKEEDAAELVEDDAEDKWGYPRGYKDYQDFNYYHDTAKESLLSAIESEGVMFDYDKADCTNQFCENGKIDVGYGEYLSCSLCEEAESRTFDKTRTLIFIKKIEQWKI